MVKLMIVTKHHSLTIAELAEFTGRKPATIRLQLKNLGLLTNANKLDREHLIPPEIAIDFIAKKYPPLYNEFVGQLSLTDSEKGDFSMFPIPTGKGIISSSKKKSGTRYYYVRNLPLYTDKSGEIIMYKSKGFTSKEEAEADRLRVINDRDNGVYKLQYLDELAKAQLASTIDDPAKEESYYSFCLHHYEKKKKLTTATKEDYIRMINARFKDYFENIPIKNLTKGLLQQFVDQYTTGVKNMRTILRQTLKKLYSLGLIPQFYYDGLIMPESTSELHPKEALTQEEVYLVLNHLKGHHMEYAVTLLFQTGLRIGELQALYWDEVEFIDDSCGRIHVNTSWGKTDSGMARKATKTKSSKRVVPFNSPKLVSLLREAKAKSTSKWVIANARGTGPIEKKNFSNRYFKKVGKELGITKPMSSHVARHTYISHLVANLVPFTTIAKLVGHDTTEMIIKVYAHAINNEEQEFNYLKGIYAPKTTIQNWGA